MSVCQNCGKNLNAFTEAYGLTGNADEPLCNTCKAKIEKALKGHTLTDDFVYLHKSELISKGVTENGLKHIQKAIDIKLHSAEREEAKRQEERLQKEKAEKEERERGDRAIANAGGLWEYKVVSLVDNDGGIISPDLL